MKPRANLPCVTDDPKREFLVGWWSGLSVGFITASSVAIVFFQAVR